MSFIAALSRGWQNVLSTFMGRKVGCSGPLSPLDFEIFYFTIILMF